MAETLRILQINSARLYVGEAAHALNLTDALRRRGHAVWLGLRQGYETFDRAAARGLDPIGFHLPHRWWPPQDLRDVHRIARLVRDNNIQIIHVHRGKEHWQAALAVKLYRLKVPVIRTRHVVTPLREHVANRWLARRTAAMVAVSRAVAEDVSRSRMYADKARTIPGGIDLALFSPPSVEARAARRAALGLRDGELAVFCVARFARVKAHTVLLRAWQEVRRKHGNALLFLAGRGGMMAALQEEAKQAGIAESVVFLGSRTDIPELLDAADVGTLASIGSEGFSRAVLEYMAKGLPVVATRVGAVPDLIDDGVNGRLVAPNDPAALSQALCDVLAASPEQRAAWGAAGRAKAAGGYSFDTWAEAHERLYHDVL